MTGRKEYFRVKADDCPEPKLDGPKFLLPTIQFWLKTVQFMYQVNLMKLQTFSSSVWPLGQIRNMFFNSGQGSGQMVKFNPGWNDLNDLFSTFSSDIMIYSMIWRYQKLKKLKRASKKSSVLHKRWSVRPAQIIFNHHSLSWTLKVNFINTLYNTWQ